MNRFSIVSAIVVSVVALIAFQLGFMYYSRGTLESSRMIEVRIPRGAPLDRVEEELAEKGLLRHRELFHAAARFMGRDKRLKAGRYIFRGDESIAEILNKMERGEVSYKRVVVPEGLMVVEVAGLMSREVEVDSIEFCKEASDSTIIAHFKIKAPSLEGYLFPDTYLFEWPVTSRDVIERMVSRFFEVFNERVRPKADSIGMKMNDVVTLASIIQAEAQYTSEMPRISAVYHNRLRLGWRLEADPTVAYALGGVRRNLRYRDLRVDSPYNTYRKRGLPPGAICNPGLSALLAAVEPLPDCKDLYFVADGSGRHIFSHTLAEHIRARERLKRRRLHALDKKESSVDSTSNRTAEAPDTSSVRVMGK